MPSRDPQSDTPEFSLEEILAEFSSPRIPEGDIVAPWDPDVPHPKQPPASKQPPPPSASPKAPEKKHRRLAQSPKKKPDQAPKPEPERPPQPKKAAAPEKPVLRVLSNHPQTQENQSPAPAKPDRSVPPVPPEEAAEERSNGGEVSLLGRLLGQAREFSSHMFEQAQSSPEEEQGEQTLPNTDEEEQEQPAQAAEEKPSRIARKQPPVQQPKGQRLQAPPDTPPQDLAERYKTGLRSLNVRRMVVLLLAIPLLLASALSSSLIQIPYQEQVVALLPLGCAAIELAALLLSYDLLADGFRHWGCNTLISVAGLLTLADGATMLWLNDREGSLPYSLVSVLALAAGLWGRYMERSSLRSACRTAASAKEPYRVTLDPCRWDGRPAYTKHPGGVQGFGSQIQSADGSSRLFRRLSPLLLLGCVVFSLLAALFSGQGELLLWNLSATTCACALFASALTFPLPYRLSTRRLTAGGAALAGWEGIRSQARSSCILLGDQDLFPPGATALNGVKIFPAFAADRVVSYTATLIRLSGSGLDRIFYEYMRSQGMAYRQAQRPAFYEGGISAVIRNDQVLVGDAPFMHLMEISLPQGLNVKNAVFCAINGELAGIFALNYALHATVRPSLFSLLSNRISPVLVTRDFNITPAMLTQRFKLPGDRLTFPAQERRRDLSDQGQPHSQTLTCLLCREGIGPLSEAVVGAKRLHAAVRLNTGLAAAGSVIGLLLAFYLTTQAAFSSLSVLNLLVFQLAWLVPILLISGWVNRY